MSNVISSPHDASMVSAKINIVDLTMLMIMWIIIYVSSIRYMGSMPGILFMILNLVLVARRSSNGLLVLFLIFFSPATSMLLPVGPFVFSTGVITLKYIVKDFLMDSKSANFNKITILVAVFIFYITLTTFISPNIDLALGYYKKYVESFVLLIIMFATIRDREDIGVVFKWWAIVAGIGIFIKLTHIYFGTDTTLFKLLERADVGSAYGLEHRLGINIGGNVANRFLWPGQEPNYASADLIFPFAISLALFEVSKSWKKIFWAIIACLISISVIGTFSRSGFLSIALVLGMYMLKGHVRAIVPAIIIGAAFLYLISTIPQLHDRIFGISDAVEAGATGRFYMWTLAFDMWMESPLWGSGLAAYYQEYQSATHNTYLQIMAETGLIGIGLFIAIIVRSLKFGYEVKNIYPNKTHPDIRYSQILLFGLISMSIMLNTITYQDMKLFWLVCGSCAAMYFVSKNDLKDKPSETKKKSDQKDLNKTGSMSTDDVILKSKSKIINIS